MDTNSLKRFAQDTRRKLLEQVGAKLSFVLNADSAELREKTEQVKQLREELNKTSKEQLIEKVAYTWFNRLMALRFMDANDYQPLGIRVITPKDGYTTPELLDEAKRGNIPDELRVNKQKVYDLLDNRVPSTNPQNEAYKLLLIAACNHLNEVLPFLFERINDYSELLLPDDLTSDFSVVTDIRVAMLSKDCVNVEIIGWLYQFYISDRKEELINSKKVYKADEIAPVTQLFTPKWIVEYMVDNTLGQYWKEARPNTKILNSLRFYIKPHNPELIPKREINSPEDIKFFDPCVGSAHVLCYAFDILFQIYEEEGYNIAIIPELIITKNLYGIDIDDRASQLAGFALMMKGRKHNQRFLRKHITLNINSFQNIESNLKFENAKVLGSLIKINKEEADAIIVEENSLFAERDIQLKRQATLLANNYDIIVTNPPYLNSSFMLGVLKQFVEKEYKDTKSDLFACFLMQAISLAKSDGLIGFISPYVWMFISSYESLRNTIINNTTISSLIQLEYNAFEPACVPVATFTLRKGFQEDFIGSYIKLSDFKGHLSQAPKTLEAIQNPSCGWFYNAYQKEFVKMTSSPIGYWVSDNLLNAFYNFTPLGDHVETAVGLFTCNNERFLRNWHEVSKNYIGLNVKNRFEVENSQCKYVPYNKGGGFKKWYGLNFLIVNFKNDGQEIREYRKTSGQSWSLPGEKFYFREGITWSGLTSYKNSFRYSTQGFVFESNKGQMLFSDDLYVLLGFLNTSVCYEVIKLINPTMSVQSNEVRKIPFHLPSNLDEVISAVKNIILTSKQDWDCMETSWDFQRNSLLNIKDIESLDLKETMEIYQKYWENKFFQIHQYEEELNRQFIENYGLLGEISPEVPLEEITILQDELDRKALQSINKKIVRNPETQIVQNYHEISLPFIGEEIISQFISYAVGCMFGRYSLNEVGLIISNQDETLQDYFNKIGKTVHEYVFLPDEDNIIPILDDEWFEDDITGRFYQFLKVTFGEKNFNKNLSFIEEQLGKDIRKYFCKDFYPDHIQRYKKRPIYWMFSSPKGSFNVLIYLHRYTPDTVNNILNKYLREFIGKLKTRREHLQDIMINGSAVQKTSAIKENDNIDKTLIELRDYERDILLPLATERIAIDLDDGVLVNYNKFGKAVKEVAGLNDTATKKKVREFDWIDTTTIR